jgi:hypothetical protein
MTRLRTSVTVSARARPSCRITRCAEIARTDSEHRNAQAAGSALDPAAHRTTASYPPLEARTSSGTNSLALTVPVPETRS